MLLAASTVATSARWSGFPALNAWEAVAPTATARTSHAVAAFDGKLYAVGGYNGDGGRRSSVERYDPVTNAWEEVAPMGTARAAHAMAVLNGKLYAVGGDEADEEAEGVISNTVERYDLATNAWEEVAPMATARVHSFLGLL